MYYMSLCVLTAYPLAVSSLSSIRDYEPLELFLSLVFTGSRPTPSLFVKILAFVIYLPLRCFGAIVFLTVILAFFPSQKH